MAEALNNDVVIGLSNREVNALSRLLDEQENLDPALVDLNNTLATL